MMSIRPNWCEKILSLEKRSELRKTAPMWEQPYKVFIYLTEGGGVIGEFICDQIDYEFPVDVDEDWLKDTCVSVDEALRYANGKALYKWRIRSLIVYQEARPLSLYGLDRPPQSWCYVGGHGE